jgi:hypothetical protein
MRGNWTQAASWIVCWGGKLLGDDNSKCSRPGLVASLARPGGNITGPELNTKRLEVIKDAVPKLARLGFLRDVQAGATLTLELKELRAAARALKVDWRISRLLPRLSLLRELSRLSQHPHGRADLCSSALIGQ